MTFVRAALSLTLAGALLAQSAGPGQEKPGQDKPEGDVIFKAVTQTVVAPVLVTDKAGNIIDGLKPAQFHLFDNSKEQNIQVDVSFQPVSLVIAIEASAHMEAILPQVKKVGSLTSLIAGEQGEIEVIAFDSRVRRVLDFTSDSDKVKVAINKINAGNPQDRMIDAVEMATDDLKKRPKNNRKIILLISETRDNGSEARVRETLINAQINNILIYSVDVTQVALRLNEKQTNPYPDAVSMNSVGIPVPMGGISSPTAMAHEYGTQNQMQFIPALKEIYKGVKLIFVANPNSVFAKGTGGGEFTFIRGKGLEDAIQRIGQEIHSQYIISYSPNNTDEYGFHELEVRTNRSDLYPKTRPGYYIAGGKK